MIITVYRTADNKEPLFADIESDELGSWVLNELRTGTNVIISTTTDDNKSRLSKE